jgi:hypothetical protein
MYNNNLGSILFGTLIGAGLGYLLADWYIDTYIPYIEETELDEPLTSEDYGDRFEIKEPKKKVKPRKAIVKNYTEFFKSQERPDLAMLAAKYNGEETDKEEEPEDDTILDEDKFLAEDGLLVDEDEDDITETEEKMDDGNDPGVVNVQVFASDNEFTHRTLNYYSDDVLTDENNIPINRPENFLGEEALSQFGYLSNDPDIVYVRNTEKRAMYEIVRLDKPYHLPDIRKTRIKQGLKEMGNVTGDDD